MENSGEGSISALCAPWGIRGHFLLLFGGGWCLALRRGMEEDAWGRVMAPKYADIRCGRIAFEAGHGWLYRGL